MSIGNNLSDVLGHDVLADNGISSEFPDGVLAEIAFNPSVLIDDDKLFDANEFIDLKQGPKPDMGLNFQARQA